MVRVKVCGLTNEKDLKAVVDAGADAVGFIVGFPESPRNISLESATELGGLVPTFVDRVLVTRANVLTSRMQEVIAFRPGAIQLYGNGVDLARIRSETGAALIRPFYVGGPEPDAGREVEGYDAVLTDTYVRAMDGGSGIRSDWEACRRIREKIAPIPLVLSGGLNSDNVAQAMEMVKPYAVDVSSGVEAAPGRKDGAKVALFVSRVRGSER